MSCICILFFDRHTRFVDDVLLFVDYHLDFVDDVSFVDRRFLFVD